MQHKFISKTDSRRLILIFAGWGTDHHIFSHIHRCGYDVMVVWDYRHLDIDWSCTAHYEEICIIAWSFGVYAASMSTHAISAKITKRIAINGTTTPVDNRQGIPVRIFEGTLSGLNERTLYKFYRRMCGTREAFESFSRHMPQRQIDELREELASIYPPPLLSNPPSGKWDLAIISRNDAIFPAVNQWRAWQGTPSISIDSHHWFDFQAIINRNIIDKQLVGARFERGFSTYDSNACVQQETVDIMCNSLKKAYPARTSSSMAYRIMEIGCGTGSLTRRVMELFPEASFELWDIVNHAPTSGGNTIFRCCDGEIQLLRTPDASFDLIISASTVQWFNSPHRFLTQAQRILTPGGRLVFSTFVKGNLEEVEQITGKGLPLLTTEQWLGIIPGHLEVVEAFDYRRDVVFNSAINVFRHLKSTGVNALGGPDDRNMFDILKRYQPDLDGRYHITYRPAVFILKKN